MIEVIKDSRVPDFEQKTEYSAGYDLYACVDESIVIHPMQTVLIPTGIKLNMTKHPYLFGMVVPRSGMSLKTNLRICNSPGIIDADYQGEVKIIMQNIQQNGDCIIQPLDRIAQIVFTQMNMTTDIRFVDEFESSSERGSNGFGSTGNK